MLQSIGRYRILRVLGEGGMGIVYAARDENLDREVAIKTIREESEPRARERLRREARLAASVNHPNVCQVYEVGEADGVLFIAMELLEGTSLGARIQDGPIPLPQAIGIAREILTALAALHARGIVHRDLKPSNVFLTSDRVKLLDFGLARPQELDMTSTEMAVTQTGALAGTPRYMAPEQWIRAPVGPTCDLFALGAILFETVSGQPAFAGASIIEIHGAITKERPPSLAGGPAVAAVDRVVQRALARRPEERHPTAELMDHELAEALALVDGAEAPRVRFVKRLLVLPFRMLRPDPEIEFLSVSIADAVTHSLSNLESLIVRSSHIALRYRSDQPDFHRIAEEAGVDTVLCGTLFRSGDTVRVTTQLVEAPSGTLLCSSAAEGSLSDLIRLQDQLARRIVESMALPLTARERSALQHNLPANPNAYEYFLRANQLAYNMRRLADARDLYEASIREDPRYAPAWAALGRVHRILAKYGHGKTDENFRLAEDTFRRALALNPDLTSAHNFYTYLEVEELGRSREAMVRLLERLRCGVPDAELYAALVVACRFCGLLDASVAAAERARHLDLGVRTSVAFTYLLLGDYQRAMGSDDEDMRYVYNLCLPMVGRAEEAIARYREQEAGLPPGVERLIITAYRAGVEGDRGTCVEAAKAVLASRFRDPEGFLLKARSLIHVGEADLGLEILERVVRGGLSCDRFLSRDVWFDPVREDPRFSRVLQEARSGFDAAVEAYTRAGGESLLGVPAR